MSEVHRRVFEYDGAYKCLDCGSEWGALPEHPIEPELCEIKTEPKKSFTQAFDAGYARGAADRKSELRQPSPCGIAGHLKIEWVKNEFKSIEIDEVAQPCPEFYCLACEREASKDAEIRELREAIIQEVHRHWLFLKYERDNGGNYEHLNTRMVEAEYLEDRIRALLFANPSK